MTEPDLLIMEASELEWISCKDSADGLAFATAQGGTMPYTFTWGGNQVGDTVNTLSPGVHLVTVIDAKGCTAFDTVEIHEPPYLVVTISDVVPVYCNGVSTGSLTAIASGGTPGYTYLWDDNLALPQITATAHHLEADVYTVTATDSRGCIATATEDISQVVPTMELDTSFANVDCHGGSNGSASVIAIGGHMPYTYAWVGPNNTFVSYSPSISNLAAGTYSVTVTDTNNCTRTSSVDIIEPLPIIYNVSVTVPETCLGACNGRILIDSVTGGTPPYVGMLTSNITGAITYLNWGPFGGEFVGACSGDYTVMVTDSGLCSSLLLPSGNNQAIVTSTLVLTDPQIFVTDNVDCFGDSTATIQLLNPDNQYWYQLVSLSVGVVDTFSWPYQINNLSSGEYFVTAYYGSTTFCTSNSDTLTITEPDMLSVVGTATPANCFGDNSGSIIITVSGGTQNYSYLWSNGLNTNQISNLSAGDYIVEITDANSCVLTDTFTVTQPDDIVVNILRGSNNTNNTAYYELSVNGNTATGGTAPYVYTWKREYPAGVYTSVGGGVNYTVYAPGSYTVTVVDANGCAMESNNFTYTAAPTSIFDNNEDVKLDIYPNPFTETAIVDFGRLVSKIELRVFNVVGEVIEVYEIRDTDKFEIERGAKVNGIYFVEIEIEEKKLFKKIIIE